MRVIDISNFKKCLDCEHCDADDGAIYCLLTHCNYKKIDFDKMMINNHDIDTSKC